MSVFRTADVITILGKRGCGKSTLCRKIQSAYPRVLVFDRLREYREPASEHSATIETLEQLRRVLTWSQNRKHFRIIFQFGVRETNHSAIFNEALFMAYQRGSICVVIEEVWNFAKPTWLPSSLEEMLFTGRHRGITLITTSQRAGRVNKSLLSQSHHTLCGFVHERNDLQYLAEELGADVEKLPHLKKGDFLWRRDGAPTVVISNQ
jgi:hypothetical protein